MLFDRQSHIILPQGVWSASNARKKQQQNKLVMSMLTSRPGVCRGQGRSLVQSPGKLPLDRTGEVKSLLWVRPVPPPPSQEIDYSTTSRVFLNGKRAPRREC